MKIYIEFLAIGIPILFFFFLYILKLITHRINVRRYKPEDDRSRKGEEFRKRADDAATDLSTSGPTQSEERGVLSPTDVSSDGKSECEPRESKPVKRKRTSLIKILKRRK